MDLEDGTRILSDYLKVGAKNAKILNDQFDLGVKASDTYATVVEKFNKKSGLNKITEELEEYIAKLDKQQQETKDETTLALNTQYLTEEINEEFGYKGELYVYSSTVDGRVEPAKAINLGVTRKNEKIVRVNLDTGGHIDCTPDHPFMLRDGSFLDAEQLIPGLSLMPFTYNDWEYSVVYQNDTCKYEKVHYLVNKMMTGVDHPGDGFAIHHKDKNRSNNDPSNLELLTVSEHMSHHMSETWKDHAFVELMSKVSSNTMSLLWENEEFIAMMSKGLSERNMFGFYSFARLKKTLNLFFCL
jgi:hypothetical protein